MRYIELAEAERIGTLGEILSRVWVTGEPETITNGGEPVAVVSLPE